MMHVRFLGIKCTDDSFLCNKKKKKSLVFKHSYDVETEEFRLRFSNFSWQNTMLLFPGKSLWAGGV